MRRFVGLVNGAMTVAVLAAAVGAFAALIGGRDPRLDLLSHLALVYAAIGAAGGVWAIAAGRGPVVAASVLALAASAFLFAPEFNRDTGPAAAPGAPGQIKVVQLNALRDNADIVRITGWLTTERADIVTVAEARHDLRDRLLARGWRAAGAHGSQMIFTRAPYETMRRPRPPPGSRLDFVNATYASSSGPIEVVTTHLAWPTEREVVGQLSDLEGVVRALPRDRMILGGDFNAAPWSGEMRRLDASLGLIRRDRALPTYPAQVLGVRWPLPFLPIDHVYAGRGWATVKVERGPWLGSDHYPLVVTLAPVASR